MEPIYEELWGGITRFGMRQLCEKCHFIMAFRALFLTAAATWPFHLVSLAVHRIHSHILEVVVPPFPHPGKTPYLLLAGRSLTSQCFLLGITTWLVVSSGAVKNAPKGQS